MRVGHGSHELEHLLGLIHCREGNIEEGVTCLSRAAEAAPANLGYKLMLARALIDSGRPQEALAVAQLPSCSTPAECALLLVAAEAAEQLGDWGRAADSYQRLAHAQPNDWRLWANLGNALAAQQNWNAAIDALRQAASLSASDHQIQRSLSAAYRAGGRREESAQILQGLLARNPADTDARLTLAHVFAEMGLNEAASEQSEAAWRQLPDRVDIAIEYARSLVQLARFSDAETVYRQVLAADPANSTAVYELGLTLERTSRMSELAELLESARRAGVAEGQLAYVAAALAFREGRVMEAGRLLDLQQPDIDPARHYRLRSKIADALGDPDGGFAAAEAMNRSVDDYDKWRRRGSEYRAGLRKMAQVITPDWCARVPRLASADRPGPAFLVGFPRSGTTLLDTFLMGHPEVQVIEEVPMLSAAERVIGELTRLPECPGETVARARSAYFEVLDQHVPAEFEGLVVDKLPLNILGGPLIHAMFPDARLVFSLRHPCDAVLSGFMQSFVLNEGMACFLDIGDAADLYDAVMDVWQPARCNLPLNVHDIRYESLVADPAASLKALFSFLDLDWRDQVLDHETTAAARGAVSTPSYDQITQPLSTRPSGRWKDYRNAMEPVLPTLLKWADRFGYPAAD